MSDMDPFRMQIEMLKAQVETQKNMYRQMYASDPAMAEQFCAQLDQNLQMQIDMISGMMGAAGPDGQVDPEKAARVMLEQLGYSEDDISQAMAGESDEAGDTLTERVLGEMDPSQFGYGDIVKVLAALEDLPELTPSPAVGAGFRRFAILLTGIVSVRNDHLLNGLDVEPRTPENVDMVRSILEDYWGVENREDLIGTLHYLVSSGHTEDYVDMLKAVADGRTAESLVTEDMDEDDIRINDARFEFVSAYAGHIDPILVHGWDLGRAANVTRWGYFAGYISEEEAWNLLEQVAEFCMESYDSWRGFAQSYIFGSMFWKCPEGPEACYENIATLMFAVEHLLTEGEWATTPWASERA